MNDLQPSGLPAFRERRVHFRQEGAYIRARLANDNRGTVLDISENGLAMHTLSDFEDQEAAHIRLQFSGSKTWFNVTSRIAWMHASKRIVGMEFIALTDDFRKELQTRVLLPRNVMLTEQEKRLLASAGPPPIMGSRFEAHRRIAASPLIDTEPVAASDVAAEDAIVARPSTGNWNEDGTHRLAVLVPPGSFSTEATYPNEEALAGEDAKVPAWRKPVWIGVGSLAALAAVAAFLFFGREQTGETTQAKLRTAAPAVAAAISNKTAPAPARGPDAAAPVAENAAKKNLLTPGTVSAATLPASAGRPGAKRTGYALQVAAMRHKENADALVASLRQLNFPASVVQYPSDHFHRVMVGPYATANEANQGKVLLAQRGFESIPVTQRAPE